MARKPSDMYNNITGYTAKALRAGGTAAEMNGTEALEDQNMARNMMNDRYPLFAETMHNITAIFKGNMQYPKSEIACAKWEGTSAKAKQRVG